MKLALAAFFSLWFLGQTWKGLFIYFTDDDMMNTYWAWVMPWPRTVSSQSSGLNRSRYTMLRPA